MVPFPFTERTEAKRRPALVLSRLAFNTAQGQLLLAMITSTSIHWPSDAPIMDWAVAGLTVSCQVRMKLFTLEQSLIKSRLGSLSVRDRTAVISTLTSVLALS